MDTQSEQTLVLIKPDAVQRRLVGQILHRLERKGLRLAALRLVQLSAEDARALYSVHEGKPFYEPLVQFTTSGPVVAVVVAGRRAIAVVRSLLGPTAGFEAAPGTIRGDFGLSQRHNLVHASDSAASARREIGLLFAEEDLADYALTDAHWVYEPDRYAASD